MFCRLLPHVTFRTRLLNYEYANNLLTREENLLTRVVYSLEYPLSKYPFQVGGCTGLCPLGHVHSQGYISYRYLTTGTGILHSEILLTCPDLPLGIRDIY